MAVQKTNSMKRQPKSAARESADISKAFASRNQRDHTVKLTVAELSASKSSGARPYLPSGMRTDFVATTPWPTVKKHSANTNLEDNPVDPELHPSHSRN